MPSQENFKALFELLYPKLVRYFVVRGAALSTAEEIGQDVLMTIYSRAESLRNKENFFGWVFKIARNQQLQYVRKHKHDVETVNLDANDLRQCARHTAGTAATEEFQQWMAGLESVEQRVMMLRYIEELSYQEIATALDIPLGTVKWKIFSAKEKLTPLLALNRYRK
jgi:RNA polymerase sigma-70 factor (ECF subfamily)